MYVDEVHMQYRVQRLFQPQFAFKNLGWQYRLPRSCNSCSQYFIYPQ